jgi:hypothetical protein
MSKKKHALRVVGPTDDDDEPLDVESLAKLAGFELGPGDHFDPRPIVPQARPVEQLVRDWVERGIDRACAESVLTGRLRQTEASEKVALWQASGKPWLRLQGGRGVGKSWAAGAWLMAGKRDEALLVEGAETVGWAEWDKRWETLVTIPRLVVDDPDIPNGRPGMWYSVLAPRYRRRLPTIVTTNAVYERKTEDKPERNAFFEWWGEYRERMESRFAEIGMAKQLGGRDLRRPA